MSGNVCPFGSAAPKSCPAGTSLYRLTYNRLSRHRTCRCVLSTGRDEQWVLVSCRYCNILALSHLMYMNMTYSPGFTLLQAPTVRTQRLRVTRSAPSPPPICPTRASSWPPSPDPPATLVSALPPGPATAIFTSFNPVVPPGEARSRLKGASLLGSSTQGRTFSRALPQSSVQYTPSRSTRVPGSAALGFRLSWCR